MELFMAYSFFVSALQLHYTPEQDDQVPITGVSLRGQLNISMLAPPNQGAASSAPTSWIVVFNCRSINQLEIFVAPEREDTCPKENAEK
jgi:hypothetical protein